MLELSWQNYTSNQKLHKNWYISTIYHAQSAGLPYNITSMYNLVLWNNYLVKKIIIIISITLHCLSKHKYNNIIQQYHVIRCYYLRLLYLYHQFIDIKRENICYGWDSNFEIEDCFALNCTLNSFKYFSQMKRRTESLKLIVFRC